MVHTLLSVTTFPSGIQISSRQGETLLSAQNVSPTRRRSPGESIICHLIVCDFLVAPMLWVMCTSLHDPHFPPFTQDNSGLQAEASLGLSSSKRLSKSNIDISAPNEVHGQDAPSLRRKQSDSYDGDSSLTGQHSLFSRWNTTHFLTFLYYHTCLYLH